MMCLDKVKQLLSEDNTEQALLLLDQYIEENPTADEAFYLRGNAYRKLEDTQKAINNYLIAAELNPDSPALPAYKMMIKILNFYNPDMFNH
jgi:tetratricopeptide (TPR) repeat protein